MVPVDHPGSGWNGSSVVARIRYRRCYQGVRGSIGASSCEPSISTPTTRRRTWDSHGRTVLLVELGRVKDAREAWANASRHSPGVSLLDLRDRIPYKRPADLHRLFSGAHRASML